MAETRFPELDPSTVVEVHDEVITNNLLKLLTKRDVLWHLGDISAGGSAAQRAALATWDRIASETGCKIHLVVGNHDGPFPGNHDAHKWFPEYAAVFDSVSSSASRKIAGHRVCLNHMPYEGDHTDEDRHVQWRLRDTGRWALSGHTHQSHPLSLHARQINVGVDAWGLWPVSLDVIARIIQGAEDGTLAPEDFTWIGGRG
ncbi:phosphoesterase [Gordonia Phage JonJames]|nr:phosphoesterase [Gordonia Phage JonJames]